MHQLLAAFELPPGPRHCAASSFFEEPSFTAENGGQEAIDKITQRAFFKMY